MRVINIFLFLYQKGWKKQGDSRNLFMSNLIKFSTRIVNNDNIPMKDHEVFCHEVNKKGKDQSQKKKTNEEGSADFEFESSKKSIEVEIEVNGSIFNYEFQNGDFVTFRLFTDDTLNIFLELLLNKENVSV